jgi:1-acyl-sn-glycerol-3-phosphate acyltransferase
VQDSCLVEAPASKREYGKLYPVAKAVLTPVFKGLWRITTVGLERLPATGGAIFCPNHTSVIDSFFLPVTLPRQIKFVGKAEYMDSWKTRHLFPAMGMIPIDRSGGSAAERALNTAARVLEDGGFFGIYPEGTRARDGRLHRGHTGPARLAVRTGVPIIPVGIIGTREIQPPDAKLPKPFKRATVRFGKPIDPSRYADRGDDRMVLRQIIDEVMYEIRELTGQEYVDEYATKKAETFPTAETSQVIDLEGQRAQGGHPNGAEDPPRRSSADVLAPRTG